MAIYVWQMSHMDKLLVTKHGMKLYIAFASIVKQADNIEVG